MAVPWSLLAAALATIMAASWLVVFAAMGNIGPDLIVPVSIVVLTLVAFVTYAVVQGLIGVAANSTRELARLLRDAAMRPRDHISVWRSLRSERPGTWSPEVSDVLDAIDVFVDRVEQRHARQTAWVGAVVHDLKTPIAASANTLVALASSPGLRNTGDAALVAHVGDELRELVIGVQRMLDVIRFEREDVPLDRVPVDLAAMIESIIQRAGHASDATVCVRGSGSAVADRKLLERAVENLIANGVRYARKRVTIEVFPGLIRIADDGSGMPAPLEHLAQPFRSEAMEVAGVAVAGGAGGIGLFLARRVLELHGGKLVVESTGRDGTVLLAYVGASNGA